MIRERCSTGRSMSLLLKLVVLYAAALFVSIGLCAGSTERVSVSSSGEQANGDSYWPLASADGRFVAFCSAAGNLVPGDTNGHSDVFVRDRLASVTTRISVSSSGEQGNGDSDYPAISADGRFVAFRSVASNLVPGDTNGVSDVFLRDRLMGTTERVSVSSSGGQANDWSGSPAISADGRFVAFESYASNLVLGDTNGISDIFVRDRLTGTTERVSVTSAGEQAIGGGVSSPGCREPCISADGRFVAFSAATVNLVPGDRTEEPDIVLRDRLSGTTETASVSSTGEVGYCIALWPAISADGRFVAFNAVCLSDMVPGGARGFQFYLRDLVMGTTEIASVSNTGEPAGLVGGGSSGASRGAGISADGRFVVFEAESTNLVPGDTNGVQDVFLRDRANATTDLVSLSTEGLQGNAGSWGPVISADGRFVAFTSRATNLVPGDTNGYSDIFVRDMGTPPPTHLDIVINQGARCATSSSVTLSFLFPDACEQMRLRNNPGDWGAWEACALQKPWTLPAGDGVKTVCMQCRDGLGNVSAEVCDDILLDTAPPQNVSISINNGAECFAAWWQQPNPTLTLSATDAVFMRFGNDGQTWSYWEPYNTLKTWPLSGARGLKTVWFQCQDSCGNESAPVSDDIWWVLFNDVTCRHPQRAYIEGLVQKGIVSGCSTNPPLYCPDGAVTRGELAEFLCKAAGKTWLDKATSTFADVPSTHPAYGWIERLADPASWGGLAVTNGCRIDGSQKYFCPADVVTRDQAAKFLCRATGKSAMASCSGIFADVSPVNPYCGYIERLADSSSWPGTVAVTGGCGQSGTTRWYCAGNPLARGQMAVFLVRAFNIAL